MTGIPLRFVTTNQGKLDFLRTLEPWVMIGMADEERWMEWTYEWIYTKLLSCKLEPNHDAKIYDVYETSSLNKAATRTSISIGDLLFLLSS